MTRSKGMKDVRYCTVLRMRAMWDGDGDVDGMRCISNE